MKPRLLRKYVFILLYWVISLTTYNLYPFYAKPPLTSSHPWSSDTIFTCLLLLSVFFGLYTYYTLYLESSNILKYGLKRIVVEKYWTWVVLVITVSGLPLIIYSGIIVYAITLLNSQYWTAPESIDPIYTSTLYGLIAAVITYIFSPMIYSLLMIRFVFRLGDYRKALVNSFIYMVLALLVLMIGNLVGSLINTMITILTGSPYNTLVYLRGFDKAYYELPVNSMNLILNSIPSWGGLLSITVNSILLGVILRWIIQRLGYR